MKKTIFSLMLLSGLILGGWFLWQHHARSTPQPQSRKVLFYQDSMHPWIKSDQPGKCTICGMDLTPIHEGQQGFGGGENIVVLSSNSVTVLNVQTEEVKRQGVRRTLRVAGTLDANETKKTIVSAPAAGRIEETAIDYAGVEVNKGQRLLTFYSPGLTQQKYRYMARAARAPEQRDPTGGLALEKGDADPYYTDLIAPLGGTVIERNVSRGQYVSEGERLFTIADSSVLWFRFDVYEQQLAWLRVGQKVSVSLPSVPGERFEAVISFIDPMLNAVTRSVKVRADISNPTREQNGSRAHLFKFGMYAEGQVRAEIPDRLAVPRAAVLYPGSSAYVYVDKGGGAYERRVVKLGQQGDDLCEVRAGLDEGESVVISGNVLLDAQAQFTQNRTADPGEGETTEMSVTSVVQTPTVDGKTNANVASAPVGRTPAPSAVTGHARPHAATGSLAPDVTARRMLEGPMFVRMAELRNAELAEARAEKAAKTNSFTESQCQTLKTLMAAAAGVSQTLAADDLKSFNESMSKLPVLISTAQREVGETAPWADWIRPLAEAAQGGANASSLVEARQQFLPFSTAAVILTKQLRKEDPSFASLRVYHCPMAPKPGLWMQNKGPLANPFYGAAMLTCGEEVK